MSLGKTGLIRPENEEFYSDGRYILVHPDDMKSGTSCVQECVEPQPLVMFIGGAKDDQYGNVLKDIFYPYNNLHESHQDIGYGTFQTTSAVTAIAREWHNKHQKICLVGHSYGGDTALKVAIALSAEDISVELVVTLDPVRGSQKGASQPKPKMVKRWLNVYVDYSKDRCGPFTPNGIAKLGGPWQACVNADSNIQYVFSEKPCVSHATAWQMFSQSRYDDEVASI